MRLIKRFLRWLNHEFTWMTSKKVLAAINEGRSYEEIEAIVQEEMKK